MDNTIAFLDQNTPLGIMVIEDDDPDAALLISKIQSFWPECTIAQVRTVREAQNYYQSHVIDLIFLDLNLPDGMGPQTVRDIKKFTSATPIIVISGIVTDLMVKECLKAGAKTVLPKSKIMGNAFHALLKKYMA